jgi:hypothetical protein
MTSPAGLKVTMAHDVLTRVATEALKGVDGNNLRRLMKVHQKWDPKA